MTGSPETGTAPARALTRLADMARRKGLLDEQAQTPPPSPCIGVCAMGPPGKDSPALCLGCWRSMEEIMAWGNAGAAQKRLVWHAILQRTGLPA